jgi:hypothetical protein
VSVEGEDLTAEAGNVPAELPCLSAPEEIAALRIQIGALHAKIEELEDKLRAFRPVHQPKWDADNWRFTEEEFT